MRFKTLEADADNPVARGGFRLWFLGTPRNSGPAITLPSTLRATETPRPAETRSRRGDRRRRPAHRTVTSPACDKEACDQAERRRLAAAGRADDGEEFARRDGEIEILQRRQGISPFGVTKRRATGWSSTAEGALVFI